MSYDLAVLDCAITMLCASPQWQAICGGLPRSRIVFYNSGDPALTGQDLAENIDGERIDKNPPLCLVDATDFPTQVIAGGRIRSGSVSLEFALIRPDDLTTAEIHRYSLGVLGLIKDQIYARRGKPGSFAEVTPTLILGPIHDPTGALAQYLTATLTLEWRALQ